MAEVWGQALVAKLQQLLADRDPPESRLASAALAVAGPGLLLSGERTRNHTAGFEAVYMQRYMVCYATPAWTLKGFVCFYRAFGMLATNTKTPEVASRYEKNRSADPGRASSICCLGRCPQCVLVCRVGSKDDTMEYDDGLEETESVAGYRYDICLLGTWFANYCSIH